MGCRPVRAQTELALSMVLTDAVTRPYGRRMWAEDGRMEERKEGGKRKEQQNGTKKKQKGTERKK